MFVCAAGNMAMLFPFSFLKPTSFIHFLSNSFGGRCLDLVQLQGTAGCDVQFVTSRPCV